MDYSKHLAEDFVLDDFFKNWVLGADPVASEFWESWLIRHPEKKQEVETAKAFILRMKFTRYIPSQEEYLADWTQLSQDIDQWEADKKPVVEMPVQTGTGKSYRWLYWRSMAASVAILLTIGAIYLIKQARSKTSVRTQYGEIKIIVLPDASTVTLNSNSQLSYASDWRDADNREVWLEGEAFFEVRKKTNGQKFTVRTRRLRVEVLGTKFNVNGRHNATQVVLTEGKVKLQTAQSSLDTTVLMRVGEWIEVTEAKESFRKKVVNPEVYSAWKNREWILDNLSLQEIADKIEETYGVHVEIKGIDAANERITGAVPTHSLPMLLEALATTSQVKITQTDNQITITP
jgi:ferric-dicitrate binding protein FerR (iron transport regulator)